MVKIQIYILVPVVVVRAFAGILCLYRRWRYGCAFRTIPLTRNKFAIVSPEDYDELNEHKWYAVKSFNTFYAGRAKQINGKRKTILMHRQIMNPAEGVLVDHVNHNGLDNRKSNLRFATYCQNNSNTRKRVRGASVYKGVQWSKQRSKWIAIIRYQKNRKFLGYFKDETEAARAYNAAAKKYHGQFASLNRF